MARRIHVLIDAEAHAPAALVVTGREGASIADPAEFSPRQDDEIIAIVPGTEVAWHRVPLPARSTREARKAAPFAIEDEIASPLDDTHVALGPREASGERSVLACSRGKMRDWIAGLEEAGFSGAKLVPDFLLLPDRDIAFDLGPRVLMRVGGRPFAVDAALPDEVQNAIAGDAGAELAVHGTALANRLARPADGAVGAIPLLDLLDLAQDEGLIDLRQGPFALRDKGLGDNLGVWMRPAALAGLALSGWLGMTLVEIHTLNRQSDTLRAEAQRLYAERFPAEGRIPDPAIRIREKVRAAAGAELDFELTSAALLAAMEAVDGASLRTLDFDAAAGRLLVSVEYSAHGDDLRLAEALGAVGLEGRLGDTRASQSGVVGELTIGEAS